MAKRTQKQGEAAKAETVEAGGPALRTVTTQTPLLYADAIGGVLMSPINTRLTFVLQRAINAEGGPIAAPALEVVIPTAGLLAFISLVRDHLKNQGPGLLQGFEEMKAQLEQQIKSE